jgi:hypothetical protein
MTVYLEIVQRLEQEVQVAEAHLVHLKAALAALQPLITINAAPTSPLKLPFSPRPNGSSATVIDVLEMEPSAGEGTPAPRRRGRPPAVKPVAVDAIQPSTKATKRSKLPASADSNSSALARTGGEFWQSLMGKRAYTVAEIVDRAIKKLEAAEDTKPVLANRLSAWLYPSIKSGTVEPAGVKGKLKRYRLVAG